YKVGEDGQELPMEGFGQHYPIYGGSYPTDIWTQYMTQAVQDLPVEEFPPRSEPEYTYVPPPATSDDGAGQEETEEPTEEPTEEESEEPTEEPSEEPSETPTEEPTEEPTDPPSTGDDDSQDGSNQSGGDDAGGGDRSEEHTSELQSRFDLV